MTTAAQQAQIDLLKSQIRALDPQISALKPAEQAAQIKLTAAQRALDAFQATPGTSVVDLIEAKKAAAANPTNAQLQEQLRITQQSWDTRQSQYLPLLRARDQAGAELVARRTPIVALESRQVDLEIEIVKIDPAQASPEAVQYAKELGEFPITNVDPAAAAIPQSTTPTRPTPTSTVVTDTTGTTNGALPLTTFDDVGRPVAQVTPVADPAARISPIEPITPRAAPVPVSDDNLAFEPTFEEGQAQIGQQLRTGPQPVTVIDPDTGQPVESLASLEARQQFAAQQTGISPYGEQDDAPDLPVDVDTTVDDTTGYIVPDGTINVPPDGQLLREPTALGGDFTAQFDPETQTWGVYDNETGEFIQTGLTEEQARTDAAIYSVGDPNYAEFQDPDAVNDPGFVDEEGNLREAQRQAALADTEESGAARAAATLGAARAQKAISEQQRAINQGDWRVRLRLADSADYLYQDPNINDLYLLYPLHVSGGVVFPYTPRIQTAYRASYEQYDLTHSNYRGYFYKNSAVDPVQISARFTAQDTFEANYLLAVIHFFRSVTKMFYGQDPAYRGSPPPLVFLDGLGQYQFNRHPCVVASFSYSLPDDVDYIRAGSGNSAGLQDLQFRRDRAQVPTNNFSSALSRLKNAGLTQGAQPEQSIPPSESVVLGTDRPTYVPTQMDIELELLPIQSREQVSKEFSLKDFASGALIEKGFW